MKQFEGQYSDEKLLLKKHESIISFIINKIHLFIIYLILSAVIFTAIKYFSESYIVSTIVAFSAIIILFLYLRLLYKNTWVIFTTRRILKLVRNGLFSQHKKELKILDIKATSARRNFLDSIFGYGTIMIQGTEEHSNIYFKGIKNHSDIANYIGRVIDYIKLNGHTDDISKYKPKKERKK